MSNAVSKCIAAVLSAACVALAGVAHAGFEERWVVPGRFYTSFAAGVEYVNLPEVSGWSSFLDAVTDDNFMRWQVEGVFGFADPEGLTLPDPIGQNARIEARVRYGDGRSDNSRSVLVPGPPAAVSFVEALANTRMQTWDADLLYQTDVVASERVTLSPLVGLTYTNLDLANDLKFSIPGFVPNSAELNDEVVAHFYGVALGSELTVRPADWVDFEFGLRADLMGASVDLDVRTSAGPLAVSESDQDSNFAARATATAGVVLNLGRLSVGVEGFARYLSYLPKADHASFPGDRASNIDGEDLWSVGGMARLTLWLP